MSYPFASIFTAVIDILRRADSGRLLQERAPISISRLSIVSVPLGGCGMRCIVCWAHAAWHVPQRSTASTASWMLWHGGPPSCGPRDQFSEAPFGTLQRQEATPLSLPPSYGWSPPGDFLS